MDLDEDDPEEIELEPYFADPSNRDGARITKYAAVPIIHNYVQVSIDNTIEISSTIFIDYLTSAKSTNLKVFFNICF